MNNDQVLMSAAVLFRLKNNKPEWFLTKQDKEDDWEIPKTVGRRGESSVRASIRNLAESAAMEVRVLEEVGRTVGAKKINNMPARFKLIYYLIVHLKNIEILQFADTTWVEYARAIKMVTNKKDQEMLRTANKMVKDLKKEDNWEERTTLVEE